MHNYFLSNIFWSGLFLLQKVPGIAADFKYVDVLFAEIHGSLIFAQRPPSETIK